MKQSKKGILSFFVLLLVLLGFAQYSGAAEKILATPLVVQAQDQWCWAGCSKSVLNYYSKDTIDQCSIADFAWTRHDCCWTPANCNSPNDMFGTAGSLQGVLNHWCVSSTRVDDALTYARCLTEINANRPFIIRYGWDNGGGHFIVGRGYYTDPNDPRTWLYLMNPWPGIGYGMWMYDYVKRAVGDHTWTHTLKGIKRNRAEGDWKITNTAPIKDGMYWKFTLSVREFQGGCGKIVRWYWDFYDQNNVWINGILDNLDGFVMWFDDCTERGRVQLPQLAKFCGNLQAQLSGRPSGYVRVSFVIRRDSGTTITRRKKIYLPPDAGGQELDETANAGYGMPSVEPSRDVACQATD